MLAIVEEVRKAERDSIRYSGRPDLLGKHGFYSSSILSIVIPFMIGMADLGTPPEKVKDAIPGMICCRGCV